MIIPGEIDKSKFEDPSLRNFINTFIRKRKIEHLLEMPPKKIISIKPQSSTSLICGSVNGLFI